MIKSIKNLKNSIQNKNLFKNKVISRFNFLKNGYGKLINLNAVLIDNEIGVKQFVDEFSTTDLKRIQINEIEIPFIDTPYLNIIETDLEKKQLNECLKKSIDFAIKN